MSSSRVKVTKQTSVPFLLGSAKITNNILNKELSTTIRTLGFL
jgi:hypothetical protein